MEIIQTAATAAIVLVSTLITTWYMRDRVSELKQDIDRRFGEVRQDIAEVRTQMLNVALAVGANKPADAANS